MTNRQPLRHGASGWLAHALALCALMLSLACPAQGASQTARPVSFAPAPAWVLPHEPPWDAQPPAEGLSNGQHILLADEQVRVAGESLVRYVHVASRAVNERGVEAIANLQVRFAPSFQTLTVHRIEVRRDGRVVSSARPSAVKLLQREASLESQIFDGRLTAHVALSDVRVGDVVEYAYSLRGHNPVFGAYRFGSFDLEWSVPVAQLHARLLWPKGRPLYWKHHNQAQAAQVTDTGTELDHRWGATAVPARLTDSDSPGWHDPYAWVEWGEFADWAAVVRWALPLYRLPVGPLPAVDREVARIAAETADPEQRLLAAVRFVQRDVRYLGIEMGVNSHEPHPPELVLQRRFGDCKDKTLLTLALLRGLGIPAHAALVHTTLQQAAADRLPTPWAFDHVLVQADLGVHRVWLDPTRSHQGGRSMAQSVQADFGRALRVAADADGFEAMAGPQARLQSQQLHTVLDASRGFDQPATLTITTRASGAAAESLRSNLASQSREVLQKSYLDFYAVSYPDLTAARPFTVQDDLQANAIEIVEHYSVPSYWSRDDKRKRWDASIEAPDILAWLRRPKGLNRQDPLALRHPVDFTLVSEFRLPGEWSVKPDPFHIEDPAFELRREEAWKGSTLQITDRYQSRSDHVLPQNITAYVAQLDKARRAVNYTLYRADAEPELPARSWQPHWVPFLVLLAMLSAVGVLAWRLYRWDPAPPSLPEGLSPLRQVGGWLWLPALGLLITPVRSAQTLLQSAASLNGPTWAALTDPGSAAYHPLWAPVLLIETALNLTILLGAFYLLALFFQRRSNVPRLYIGWWALMWVGLLIDAAAFSIIPSLGEQWKADDKQESVRAMLVGLVWVTYFLRSQRVRRTFVVRRQAVAVSAAAATAATPGDAPPPPPTAPA